MIIRIATRDSQLAIKQSLIVADALKKIDQEINCELIKTKTKGDILLEHSLSKIGGKGLFIKEVEEAIIDDRADIAVHSMKDVPSECHDELEIPCILKRGDERDAFVSKKYKTFYDLPKNANIGTSSHRRKGQILAMRQDINIIPIRGNINSRINKMLNEEVDALILAAAGLKRNHMEMYINHYFSKNDMLPAIAQGAIGVQVKKSNYKLKELIAQINDQITFNNIQAEREFMRIFGANCSTPIAANCVLTGDRVMLKSGYFFEDGSMQFHSCCEDDKKNFIQLGNECANNMLKYFEHLVR
ncbi:MAG: hydroxymethylbilane synthase [Candidatus Midichloriaceae bacterium]|jgi:hydroxymethylbilane synthase